MSGSESDHRLINIVRRWCSSLFLYNDSNEDERTQILNNASTFRTTSCEKVWIAVLGLLLIAGVSASTYLLIVEGRRDDSDNFTLVSRNEWISLQKCENSSKLSLPVQKVLLLPTNSSSCFNETDCRRKLKSLRQEHIGRFEEPDILYNFVMAGDDRIYEGRGWRCSSSFLDNGIPVLAIAFLGKYDNRSPTEVQTNRLESFLDYAVMMNRLSSCYQILVRDSTTNTRFMTDLAFDLESRREKNIC